MGLDMNQYMNQFVLYINFFSVKFMSCLRRPYCIFVREYSISAIGVYFEE